MTEPFTDDGALAIWSTPQCPFTIEYSRKALDDIRLAVVDAFFSLPRGGAEIGGILLGTFDGQRLQILDYAPLECEHAFGPAFTLSPADQDRLETTLGEPFPGGLQPVGWYHSHTRSEISLNEADLDIHNRYFPEHWQIALVLRPSAIHPAQAGFFFRESDGSIHAQRSYHEFVVETLPAPQVPSASPSAGRGSVRQAEPDAVVMTLQSQTAPPPPVPAPQPEFAVPPTRAERITEPLAVKEPEPVLQRAVFQPAAEPFQEAHHEDSAPFVAPPQQQSVAWSPREEHHAAETYEPRDTAPAFTRIAEDEPRLQRRWVGVAAGVAVGLVLGLLANQTRSHSEPAARAVPQPAIVQPSAAAPENSALRRQNERLTRQVADLSQQNSTLSQQNNTLRNQNAELTKQQAESGKQQNELTKAQGEAGKQQTELRQQRDDLVKQTAKLKADLSTQAARAQSLQLQLEDLRRQQQRRRLSIQSSDPLP